MSDTQALHNLKEYWGFDTFRPGQERAISAVLSDRDTLVLFPTGGGKSICYQVPATVRSGLTLVISPLVALMQDQVEQLKERGIPATFINSTLSSWEVEQRLVNARNGMYRLLYCAPERLATPLWEAELPNLDITLVAVDEAHCISEWGHDFRPAYREIRTALEDLDPEVPWMALTATATPEVRKDILETLQMDRPEIVSMGFERPNLKWWVMADEQKDRMLGRSVKKGVARGSGLVYGGTRRNCEEIADRVRRRLGVKARAYHAGIDSAERREIQQAWVSGELPVVAATSAFGLGIDKADCRFVIHYQMAYSLEAYYQEAGRAGRDGEEAFPILLFKRSDEQTARQRIMDSYPEREQLQRVYDALCDHLNLALGSEMEQAAPVPLAALRKRASLPERIVHSALKILDRLGMIQMIDYIAPQIGVHFTVAPDYLRQKIDELENRRKAEFLDTLLRQFGAESFAGMHYLDREYLQQKLAMPENAIVKGLDVLARHDQMLLYESSGNQPMVRLLHERISTLPFGKKELERHRDNLLKKLDYVIGYIQTDRCREQYIRVYFGEEGAGECGHCDNCLRDEDADRMFDEEDFETVRSLLNGERLTLRELRSRTGWKRQKLQGVLSFLISEEQVESDGDRFWWKETG